MSILHRLPPLKTAPPPESAGQIIHGWIKFYNSVKGYGFITADGIEKDIFIHCKVLRHANMVSVRQGMPISGEVVTERDGRLRMVRLINAEGAQP